MRGVWILVAALASPVASAAYKCVDEKGTTHVGDTPPPACANVMIYEVSKSGQVLRRIEPTPTPEEARQRGIEAEKRKAAEKAAAEQKRKDLSLLGTYSDEREIDVTRDRNIEPLKIRITVARERIEAVEKRQKEIEEEMEFYTSGKSRSSKGRQAPPELVADLERARKEKGALLGTILNYEKEIEQIKARYEGEKERWRSLKNVGAKAEPRPAAGAGPAKKY